MHERVIDAGFRRQPLQAPLAGEGSLYDTELEPEYVPPMLDGLASTVRVSAQTTVALRRLWLGRLMTVVG